jgi:hypothetical protein
VALQTFGKDKNSAGRAGRRASDENEHDVHAVAALRGGGRFSEQGGAQAAPQLFEQYIDERTKQEQNDC